MKSKKLLALLLSLVMLLAALPLPASASPLPAPGDIKNVIFMIGDGMGENHLNLAKQEGYTLFMEDNCDLRGQSKTRSLTNRVTDSAAGATALSCGVRTYNSALCVYLLDPLGAFFRPRIITENAMAHGMKTGIVTTDKTTGATPAGYSVHVTKRDQSDKITARQLESNIDLIWGAAAEEATRSDVEAAGYTYISTFDEMDALTAGTRSFGQFSGDTWRTTLPAGDPSPTLVQMSEKAIELLNTDNENGLFLMIEGAHIDKNSHRKENDLTDWPEKRADAANAVKGFDDAIKAAVEFARADGHTLVVVTADHETGDLYLDNGEYTYHSGSHTAANVPVLVYGANDLFAPGEAVENKSLPARVAAKLGWEQTELPHTDPGAVLQKFKNLLKAG